MRIVEIIPQLTVGGAEKFTVELSNELAIQGHEVFLVVTNTLDKYGDLLKFLDPRVNIIGMNKKSGVDLKLFPRLTKLIRELKPDVVHTHLGAIVYNLLTPLICKKPVFVHTIHNSAEKEASTGGRLSVMARKIMFKYGRTIPVSISEESLNSFYNFYGNDFHSEIILNGVSKIHTNSKNASEISTSGINLVNVARIMPQKNHKMLVEAVQNLRERGYDINLYIIGDNTTPEAKEILEMKLSFIHLLGKKDNPRDYIAKSDAFVLSSLYEGMPLVLIESMSVGAIPLCTPVGGVKNMITDGINGILFKDVSVSAIEDGILRFMNTPDKDKELLRQNSIKSFEKYTMSACVSNYLKLFRSI